MYYFVLFLYFALIAALISSILYYGRKFWLYRWAMKSSQRLVVCPRCHSLVPLRYFLCPNCRRTQEIVPREDSIFRYRCECGKVLPTTNGGGRTKLTAVCPRCGNFLGKNAGFLDEMVVPIVGSPSSGKTAFLAAWTYCARRTFAKKYRTKVSFSSPIDEKYGARCDAYWTKGIKPEKTSIAAPRGVGLDFVVSGKKRGVRLYCYDPAGEVFDSTTALKGFYYYEYMDGVIFLVDPFSLRSVRNRYRSRLQQSASEGFQVAESDLNDCCDRFLNSLKTYRHLKTNERHSAFCAVVVAKVDAFDLSEIVGAKAIERVATRGGLRNVVDAQDAVCSRFLEKNGMGDVLMKLRDHFNDVKCFSVSAFGRMPDSGKPFVPVGVELPFLWIFEMARQYNKRRLPRLDTVDRSGKPNGR